MSIKKLVLIFGLLGGVNSKVNALAVRLFDDLDSADFFINSKPIISDCVSDFYSPRKLEEDLDPFQHQFQHQFQRPKFIRSLKLRIKHHALDTNLISEKIIEIFNSAKLEELMKKLSCFMEIKKNVTDLTKNSEQLAENLYFLTYCEKFNLEIFRLELKNLINEMITLCKEAISSEKEISLNAKKIEDFCYEFDLKEEYGDNIVEVLQKHDFEFKKKINNSLEACVQWCEDVLKLLN